MQVGLAMRLCVQKLLRGCLEAGCGHACCKLPRALPQGRREIRPLHGTIYAMLRQEHRAWTADDADKRPRLVLYAEFLIGPIT